MNAFKVTRRGLLASSLALSALLAGNAAMAEGKITLGLALPFQGNGWQAGVVASANWAVEEAKKAGKDVELVVVDAAGDPQAQIQQINNLVLQGVSAILLEPLSDTALNGAIDSAADAGIPVITFGTGSVTNAKAIDLNFDFMQLGKMYVGYIAERTGGKGNALNVRGLAGNQAEQAIQDALLAALAEYPDIKIVSEVYGDWNQSVAQQKIAGVLPTLPQIDIVFSQGVAAFGAAQAFMAAGKDVPLQVYGFDGMDLKMLMDLNAKSGYESVAINTDPGAAGAAVNVALAKLSGVEVPMKMIAPIPQIPLDQIKADYATVADGDTIWVKYDYDYTLKNIIGAK
jgi:ribose transport system substrate-binding protein